MNIKLTQFKQEIEQELADLLSWWMKYMPDKEYGGFYGRMDGYGNLDKKADKGIILNARLLWTFASAGLFSKKNRDLELMADRAYQYLVNCFADLKNGGFYWTVDYKGKVVDTTKQIYAQAFAVYALCAYYDLNQKAESLKLAWDTVRLIELYARDQEYEGYFNVYDEEWAPIESAALSEKDIPADKIMNTHLHILEAYTKLYVTDPNPESKSLIQYIVDIYSKKIFNSGTGHTIIYFDRVWKPLTKEISYGHDIESSWLMMEAAESLGMEPIINSTSSISMELAAIILKVGRDEKGGIYEKTDPLGEEIEKDKHWWPQAEAVVGFMNAFQISHQVKYLDASKASWEYIKNYFKDYKKGEWHWLINENGSPILSQDKAGPWKAPYHNVRMCLEVLKRLNHLG